MKDLFLLNESLKQEIAEKSPNEAFGYIIKEMAKYYMENLSLDDEEVAFLLVDRDKSVLSFCQPEYLVNSGLIPISSNDSVASALFRNGKDYLENNFQQHKHLNIFETIKTPENEIKPVWKMLATVLTDGEEKLGVIELSRRSIQKKMAGPDFTMEDLTLLKESQVNFAKFLRKVMPENFRGSFDI